MSASDQENSPSQGPVESRALEPRSVEPGAVGRLPRLQPFDISTYRAEPRPTIVPPLLMVHDEPWRPRPANVRLPSCGDTILGPIQPCEQQKPTSAAPAPAVARPRSRPALWAAGLVAAAIVAVPIFALQATSGHLGGGGGLLEGRSSSAGGMRAVPTDDGVPLISADPRPFKVPAGSDP